MESDEISTLLKKICGDQFIGVFPWSQLPTRRLTKSCLFVVNTDCKHLPGTHWIAIYIGSDGMGEYFDSFGRKPDSHLELFMNMHCRQWSFNDRQLQHINSKYCRNYCVFFCAYRSVGFCMQTIVSWFSHKTNINDALVHRFVCKRL